MAGLPFSSFQYQPLPNPTSTRLVRFLDRQEDDSLTICGNPLMRLSIEAVDLEDEPRYTALSYTWGCPFPRDWEEAKDYQDNKWPILLNDSLFSIPKNLYDYFCKVHPFPNSKDVEARFEPYNKTGLIVEAEKGNLEGVKLYLSRRADIKAQDIFGETALHYAAENGYFEVAEILIFSGSDPTIIDCHGRSSLDCAIEARRGDYQKVIALLAIEVVAHQKRWHNYWYRPMEESAMIKWYQSLQVFTENISTENNIGLRAIQRLFRRTWFERMWVIQELALAKDVEIVCGPFLLPYKVFHILFQQTHWVGDNEAAIGMFDLFEKSRDMGVGGTHLYTLTDVQQRTTNNLGYRDLCVTLLREYNIDPVSTWTTPLSLSLLVAMTWGFRATNPRDKIYALLGIARKDSHNITADYSKSVPEVFIEFARTFMDGAPNEPIQESPTGHSKVFGPLEGLSFIQDAVASDIKPSLPSWVPDFSSCLVMPRLWTWSTPFTAGGTVEPKIYTSEDPSQLRLQGIWYDEIARVESRECHSCQQRHSIPTPRELFNIIQHLDTTYAATGEDRIEAMWRTMMANQLDHNKGPPGDFEREGFTWLINGIMANDLDNEQAMTIYEELYHADHSGLLPSRGQMKEREGVYKDYTGPNLQYFLYYHYLQRTYRGRCLFVTRKGYVGLGPLFAREGDEVWIIPGAKVPFVFGKAPDNDPSHRVFKGESYVHGIMHGEVIRDHEGELSPVALI